MDEIIKCSYGYDIKIVESWGRLDKNLNVVIEPQFAERLQDDCVIQYVQVVKTRKWGLYNVITHSFLIQPIYDEMYDFGSKSRTHINGNLIVVKTLNKRGCISEEGNEIVPCQYEEIHICDVSPQYVMAGNTYRNFIPYKKVHASLGKVYDVYNVNGDVIIKSCRLFKKCEIDGYTDCKILTSPVLVDDSVILNYNNESVIPDENGNIIKFSYPINLPYDLDCYTGITMQKVSSIRKDTLVCQAKYPFIFNRASGQVIRGLNDEKFMDMIYYSNDYIVVGMDDGRSEFSDRIYSYIYTDHRGRFGAINLEGEIIIPPIYAVLTRPSCGFVFAAKITKQTKKMNGDMKVETLDIYLIEIKSRKSIICYKDVPESTVETMLETGCLFVTTKEKGLTINDTYSWNEIIIPRYSRYTTHEMSYISSYAFKPRGRINEKYWDGQGFYKPEMEDRLD